MTPPEFMDPEEKHMIERLSNPTPRTLRTQSRGYSSGYHSPCSTLGSLKSHQQYTRRPPEDLVRITAREIICLAMEDAVLVLGR